MAGRPSDEHSVARLGTPRVDLVTREKDRSEILRLQASLVLQNAFLRSTRFGVALLLYNRSAPAALIWLLRLAGEASRGESQPTCPGGQGNRRIGTLTQDHRDWLRRNLGARERTSVELLHTSRHSSPHPMCCLGRVSAGAADHSRTLLAKGFPCR